MTPHPPKLSNMAEYERALGLPRPEVAEPCPPARLASRLVLLVNGSRARLFELARDETSALDEHWHELRTWVWPPRRLSDDAHHLRQTGRERHGHVRADSLVPTTSPEALDHARFARLLARTLTLEPRFEAAPTWVMLASPAMLGALRRQLPASALQRLSWSADVDLTACSPRTLSRSLRALQRMG